MKISDSIKPYKNYNLEMMCFETITITKKNIEQFAWGKVLDSCYAKFIK